MTQPKLIVQDLLPWIKKYPWWQPFSEKSYLGVYGIMQFLYAKNVSIKLIGLIRFLKIIPGLFSTKNRVRKKDVNK